MCSLHESCRDALPLIIPVHPKVCHVQPIAEIFTWDMFTQVIYWYQSP
jgi:hypothetical protein